MCSLCPRMCGVDRSRQTGACSAGDMPLVAKAMVHRWEEPCISGTKGSGTVFFSGCPLHCVYCQNEAISRGGKGEPASPARLREIYFELIGEGVHNINLVTATQFLPQVIQSLDGGLPVPVVYNTSAYERPQAIQAMQGHVQIYLPDLKYLDAQLAETLSGAPDYPAIAKAAILAMVNQTGPYRMDEDGILQGGVLIRHLILPGELDNTFDVIDWVAETFPRGTVLFHLMSQYLPCGKARQMPGMDRRITQEEYERAQSYLIYSGIEDGYIQDPLSADDRYIPDF